MKRGEIWLLKGRPVLIVSPKPFNRITKVPIVSRSPATEISPEP
jgi:mRNA-degrading endonuclease toxin of MazEF toxin-antitoxin module